MNITFEYQKKYKAIAWTIGVHALLLVLFLFLTMNIPSQAPVEELGMEVNLGLGENGFGDEQPEDPNDPANELNVTNNLAGSNDKADQKDIYASEDPDAPVIQNPTTAQKNPKNSQIITNKQKKTSTSSNTNNNTNKNQTTAQNPKYTYVNSNGLGGNKAAGSNKGGNEGKGSGNGDAGVIGGQVGANNYVGTPGKGNASWPHTLDGRYIAQEPDKTAEFSKGGKVKVFVTVNREGNIKSYNIESTASTELRDIVAEKIKRVKFNKSSSAPVEQKGYINFTFKVGR